MLGIWAERQVLSESFITDLRAIMDAEGGGSGSSSAAAGPSSAADKLSVLPAPSVAELEALYEAVATASQDDHNAQKQADAMVGLGGDSSTAVESVVALKKCLEASIEKRSSLVDSLRQLLAHQRNAADTLSYKIEVNSTRLEAARGLRKQLQGSSPEDEPAAKRAKAVA